MTQYKSEGEEIGQLFSRKERCFSESAASDASTMLPSSPRMSRLASPQTEEDFDELLEEAEDDCMGFEFSGLPDEVSKAVLPTIQVAQSAACAHKVSGPSSSWGMIFLPVLFGLFMYAVLNFVSLRVFVATVAALMVLPGLYLFFVDGCRPEDYEEEGHVTENGCGASVLLLVSLALGSIYGMCVSMVFRILVAGAAALMVLPGLYLYVVDGCRPEDFEVGEGDRQKGDGAFVLSLIAFGLASIYGMCISTVFCFCAGGIAVLMVLPGLYLYVVEGCRPEDCEVGEDDIQKGDGLFVLSLITLGLASIYGMCISTVFCFFAGSMAILMALPGLYLYVVEDCRPEDYEAGEDDSQKGDGVFVLSLIALGLACIYGMCISTVFCFFAGSMAILMVLPGLYLYVVEGCRPEDYEVGEDDSQKDGVYMISLLTLGLGCLYAMYISGFLRVIMGTTASLMLLPGLYLYTVDGCRPEDYDEEESKSQWSHSASALLLAILGLGFFYCVWMSMIFRFFMGVAAALMLLPGLYLYTVEGCRPEDCDEEDIDSQQASGTFVLALVALGLGSFYGMYVSRAFCVCMGVVASFMFFPGLCLYVVEGCRPEDCQEDLNLKQD